MLIGEFTHSLDPKKRLAIPAKFRKELGAGAIITRGLESCLFVFPRKHWQELVDKISAMPMTKKDSRAFARLILSGAAEVEFDRLGRILIPDFLKNYAGLAGEAVIAGVSTRLEIWNSRKWAAYKKNLEKNSDEIAEKLGDLGMI